MSAPARTNDYQPVAQQPKQLSTHQLLKALTPEIARALPAGMDADRIARLVMTEIRKNPLLGQCTQDSFAGALLTASALGLEPGVNGEAYLVPYRDKKRGVIECQLIIGYQGITKLFWQHPRAARVDTQMVCANDEFRYSKGLHPILEHVPAPSDRGEPIGYYAIVGVTGAEPLWDYFTVEQIKNLRRGKVGSKGDIADTEHWMERKTALKQVLKLAPKTTRLDQAIRSDERSGAELSRPQGLGVLPPPPVDTPAIAPPSYIEGDIVDDPEPGDTGELPADAGPPTEINSRGELLAMRTQMEQVRGHLTAEKYRLNTKAGMAEALAFVAQAINREIGSLDDLSETEAAELISVFTEPAAAETATPEGELARHDPGNREA